MTEKTLADFMQQNSTPIQNVVGVKKIVVVASTKGGVGKSTLACNLAIAAAQIGNKVALVDADIYGPSVPHLMNLSDKPQQKNGMILPLISYEVRCISIGSMIDANAAGVWRGPMVTKILYQLIRSINWKWNGTKEDDGVDLMIIDMPPGTGDVYLSIAEKFPISSALIISTPQSLSIIDVVKSIDCFAKLKIPLLGIVQNMSYLELQNEVDGKKVSEKKYLFGQEGAKKLAERAKINFLGDIPIVEEMSKCSEEQIPFVVKNINSPTAEIFREIAKKFLG